MKKNIILILSLILVIFAGCSSSNIEQNGNDATKIVETKPQVVEVVITKVGFNPIFYPLENNKISMPEGIEVKLRTAGYSQAELYTLSSEANLVGILSNVNIAKAYEKGVEFKVIAPYYREIVGPDGFSMGQIVVKKDSEIKSVNDLVGKKVGIQGSADGSTIAMMTALKNKYNLDLDKVEWVAVDSNLAPELVRSGELEASMFDSDYIIDENFNDNFRTLQDFGLDLQELYGVVPPAKFFVVRKDVYDQNPELFDNAVNYIKENYKWSREHKEEISKLEADATGDDYDILVWKFGYESRLDDLTQKDLDVYEAFYEIAKDRGIIQTIPNVKDLFVLTE